MPRLGRPIPVNFVIPSRATDRYVRATVRDATGAQIGGLLPVPHLAGGHYKATGPNMPATDHVTVKYDVFTDAGYTTPDPTNGSSLDVFEINDSATPETDIVGEVLC